MGLTPLEGLPGATRSGSLDPSLIFHYTSTASKLSSSLTDKIHITKAEDILNKKSGWKALTGTTDFGVVTKKAGQGDGMAILAVDILVDRVVGYIGNYWVKMGGKVDAIVFAGGIGEKGKEFREEVCKQLECLGVVLDKGKNERVNELDIEVIDISAISRMKTLVVRTDEQVYAVTNGLIERLKWRANASRSRKFGTSQIFVSLTTIPIRLN
jgi:acetate kinase